MAFELNPSISLLTRFHEFLVDKEVGDRDLILTSKYMPLIKEESDRLMRKPHILYIEEFGEGEPKDTMVDLILDRVKEISFTRVIAIGGGTVIDVAKLLIFEKGLNCEEIFEKGASLHKKKQLIVLPTTCGTGSEVTGISICEFTKKATKLGLAIPALFPDEAVLIPELLESLPYDPFAASAIDALVHAMESFLSPKANEFSRMYSTEAIRKILTGFQIVGKDKEQRNSLLSEFLIASCYAGIAFSNAGCATVHAMSYPLGAVYHIPHGKANYYVFLEVFQHYKKMGVDLVDLETIINEVLQVPNEQIWETMETLLEAILPLKKLTEFGLNATGVVEFAASVIKNQQRLLKNSPIELSEDEIIQIYSNCLTGGRL